MKRPRVSTVLGIAVGLALTAIVFASTPGCSTWPNYIDVGLHMTTTPPPTIVTPPPTQITVATPVAPATK